jgi:hypothetical protein
VGACTFYQSAIKIVEGRRGGEEGERGKRGRERGERGKGGIHSPPCQHQNVATLDNVPNVDEFHH